MKYPYDHGKFLLLIFLFAGIAGCFFSGKNPAAVKPPISPKTDFLLKDSALTGQFEITEAGIFMYENPEMKIAGTPEAVIYPEEYHAFSAMVHTLNADTLLKLYKSKGRNRWPDSLIHRFDTLENRPVYFGADSLQPLKGFRIALDPGHIAGDFETAVIEGKSIKMNPSPATRMQTIQFFEAGLTLATAWAMREELETLGAIVMMTRTRPGTGAKGLTFEEWKTSRWDSLMQEEKTAGTLTEEEIQKWKNTRDDPGIMTRFFTPEDLRERAKRVNLFQPHLTLIIHYNVDLSNWQNRDSTNNISPTEKNYCMAFVPGAFMEGELAEPIDRLAFLRMMLTNDVEKSVRLSDLFIGHSTRITGVPVVSREYPLRYLHKASVYTGFPGVYARNLSLTRLIYGPVCYGESLCQDNLAESLAFNNKDTEIGGVPVSSRVKVVAKAYVETVKEYLQKEFPNNSDSGKE
ncbi:MAG: hypothetical protein SF052_02290 [Bacteroidia bacterium]|nr:hypothetical protein [Bacteroidia bacterium]